MKYLPAALPHGDFCLLTRAHTHTLTSYTYIKGVKAMREAIHSFYTQSIHLSLSVLSCLVPFILSLTELSPMKAAEWRCFARSSGKPSLVARVADTRVMCVLGITAL